jgi:hypothetical protein
MKRLIFFVTVVMFGGLLGAASDTDVFRDSLRPGGQGR